MPALPRGAIIEWWGSIASIPAGYILCNGANGTPDLRNRFIVGAGDTYAVDDTGGAVNHTHPFTSDGHFHTLGSGGDINAGLDFSEDSTVETVFGTTDNADGRPPYHALAYIMKT